MKKMMQAGGRREKLGDGRHDMLTASGAPDNWYNLTKIKSTVDL